MILCLQNTVVRIVLAALALSILALPGCLTEVNLPVGIATEALSTQTYEQTPVPSVTLALLGDVMLGRDIHPTSETFAYLKPFLKSADLALANLESPLTDDPVVTESPYALCAPPEDVRYLLDASLDYLSLANNHRLDCGAGGLSETQKTLTDAGLGFIGPDPEPVYRTVNGVPLALLAFDATTQFDIESAAQAVRSAHEASALVIVAIHWGTEYQAGVSTDQKQIAERLAQAGAALIWGHHPHVLQPAQWIEDGKTLVFYSLGNALFDQYGLESTHRSALLLVKLNRHRVEEFQVIPFLIDVRNSRVIKAGKSEAQSIMQYFP